MILKLSNRRNGWYYFEVERVATRVLPKEEYCGEEGRELPAYDLQLVDFPLPSKDPQFEPCFRAVVISFQKKGQDKGGTVATSHAAFLMNDNGDTIEVLNPDPGEQLPPITKEEAEAPRQAKFTKPEPNPGIDRVGGF